MSSPPLTSTTVWALILVGLNLVYLAFELAFNSRIVDLASGGNSASLIDFLETQGRILSGIGLALLLIRLTKTNPLSDLKSAGVATAITLFSITSMYLAQAKIVDVLVHNASGEDRLNAKYLGFLKVGIANDKVQLDDIVIPADSVGAPSTNAFLNMVPAMIFASDEVVMQLREEVDYILDNLAEREARRLLPEAYEAT